MNFFLRNESHCRYEIHDYKLQPSVIMQAAKLTCTVLNPRRS